MCPRVGGVSTAAADVLRRLYGLHRHTGRPRKYLGSWVTGAFGSARSPVIPFATNFISRHRKVTA